MLTAIDNLLKLLFILPLMPAQRGTLGVAVRIVDRYSLLRG